MATERHLRNAPVREALIDIQFEPRIDVDVIGRFANSLKKEFPKQQDMWETLVGFTVEGDQTSTNTSHAVMGKRLDTEADLHILQCRTNGFTFSRLAPYVEWRRLREDAMRLWDAFVAEARPQTVKRIAVRYINEVKLPLPIKDFGDYLVCPPKVPEMLPQEISGFMQRVVIPDAVSSCTSIVNQMLEGPSSLPNGHQAISVILDIDVFRQADIDATRVDEIFESLDSLRLQKNRMFFGHLTEQAVEMFE